MAGEHSKSRRGWSALRDPAVWAIFAIALALRLIYLADLRHTPFFSDPQMDALYHDQWARRLAAGDWWGGGVFFRAPLYPYFLGLLYALTGTDYLVVRLVQFAIGAGTAALTAVLAGRRFGRPVGLIAGLLVAVYGPLIYFEGELLLVVLEAPLNLLAAWSLDRAISGGARRSWVTAGIWLGLAALVRPTILAVVPVVAAYLLLRRGRAALRPSLLYAAAVLAAISPALAHNATAGRDMVPIAAQGGLNYFLGNNAAADGRSAIAPDFRRTWTGGIEDAQRQAEVAAGRELKPSEVSDYWLGRSLLWAREDPGAFLRLQARKFLYFWDAYEIPNNQDYYFFSQLTRIFRLPLLLGFGVLGPLAVAGLGLGLFRRRLPFAWGAVPLTLTAVVVAFFVCDRFRVVLVPLFAVWGAGGLVWAFRLLRERRRLAPVLYGLLLCATAWGMNADLAGHRHHYSRAESNLRMGIFFAARGDNARAFAYYKMAVGADPGFADGWNNLGVAQAQGGDLGSARSSFEAALHAQPRHPKALGNLASLAMQEGRPAEADSLARRTLRVAGRDPEALYNAAVVLGNLGAVGLAAEAFHQIVYLQPWNAPARLGEARALIALGRRTEAITVLEALPPDRRTDEVRAFLKEIGAP